MRSEICAYVHLNSCLRASLRPNWRIRTFGPVLASIVLMMSRAWPGSAGPGRMCACACGCCRCLVFRLGNAADMSSPPLRPSYKWAQSDRERRSSSLLAPVIACVQTSCPPVWIPGALFVPGVAHKEAAAFLQSRLASVSPASEKGRSACSERGRELQMCSKSAPATPTSGTSHRGLRDAQCETPRRYHAPLGSFFLRPPQTVIHGPPVADDHQEATWPTMSTLIDTCSPQGTSLPRCMMSLCDPYGLAVLRMSTQDLGGRGGSASKYGILIGHWYILMRTWQIAIKVIRVSLPSSRLLRVRPIVRCSPRRMPPDRHSAARYPSGRDWIIQTFNHSPVCTGE